MNNGGGFYAPSNKPAGAAYRKPAAQPHRYVHKREEAMSLDFYDRKGRPYAYSDDDETIYTFSGIPIAYINDDSIYAFSGRHIGYFNDGIIRDQNGDSLLFTDDASGGPMKPMKMMKPMKNMKQMKPMKSMKEMKPMRPMKTLGWSSFTPEEVFER